MTTQLQQATWKEFTQQPKDLILSDSMLGDVDQNKLQNTKVISISGGRAQSLQDELKKPAYHGARFNNLTIVSGTNDIKDANGEAEKVSAAIDKYKELISDAKAIADNVQVASVCPRLDEVKDMVEPYNANLQIMCEQVGAEFIDNTPIFTLGDGTTNDGYLVAGKGPHLTKSGVNKFIRNLRVKTKNPNGDVTKEHRRQPQKKPPVGNGQPPGGSGAPRHPPRDNHRARGGRPHQRFTPQFERNDNVAYHRDGCVYCNEPGHNGDMCKHRDQGGVMCYTCGQEGHKSKHHYNY